MAIILSFRTAEFRTGEGSGRRAGDSAEVIVFPGIRYERWSDTRANEPKAAVTNDPCRTSRDVLELAE